MYKNFFTVLLASIAFVQPSVARDVPYVPTPEPVVEKMLELAKVGPNDLVYNSSKVVAQPIIVITVTPALANPASITVDWTWNGVAQTPLHVDVR